MKDEIIIDIKELCHRILNKWKIIILAAIVGAFVMNIAGYVYGYWNYMKTQPVDDATLEKYKEKLTDKELETVEQTYDTYEIYKKQYESELNYNKNSILMKLGEDNTSTVEMHYYIDNHYESVYPVIEQSNNVLDIIETYSLYLTSDEVIDKIKECEDVDIEKRYLKELISVEPIEDTQTMKIIVCSASNELTNKMADIIEQEVGEYTKKIQDKYGQFDILDGERCEISEIDNTIFELQQSKITSITNLRIQLDSIGNDLNDNQQVYYNALVNNAEEKEERFNDKVINIKYILLGCVLGIALMCLWIVVKYWLQNTIRNQTDLKDMYHCYTFGVIGKTKNELDIIVKQIEAFALRNGIHKIGLISTNDSEEVKKIFQMITSKVEDDNLEICIACGIDNIPDLIKKNSDTNQVIIIEEKNGSTYQKVEHEMELCDKCQLQILGTIIINAD